MALKESTAKWKIVVGHHTIKSAGHHGNTDELVVQLLPILQVILKCLPNGQKKKKNHMSIMFEINEFYIEAYGFYP